MAERMRRRQRALGDMAHDVGWLVRQPRGSQRWTGTQRDLVEMVHAAWRTGTIAGDDGLPLSQRRIAELAFAAVGRKAPKALTHIVCCIGNRADTRRSMVERYMRLGRGPEMFNQRRRGL